MFAQEAAGRPLALAIPSSRRSMLYWAEGLKRRGIVRLVNSDVHMLAFFRGPPIKPRSWKGRRTAKAGD
jgi:hypothetical protein